MKGNNDVYDIDVNGYLARLRLPHPGSPGIEALRALHRAHVEHIPYENLDIYLGRPTSINPYDSLRRVLSGKGGYCYHLNGAFALLLSALGYGVRRHKGGVQMHGDPKPVGASGNHLALTVHGLPTRDNPDGMWLVDVGLGDALHEPLPLRTGRYTDGPFQFGLAPSSVEFLGWRFDHDPRGSFTGMDFRADEATATDFQPTYEWLSTAPQSPHVRQVTVIRRDATGADVLRGPTLTHLPDGTSRDLTGEREWFDVLAEVFGLVLPEMLTADRADLWRRVSTAPHAWQVA